MIEFKNVHKNYILSKTNIVHALQGISFKLEEGSSTAVIGPSGSGKSTLLNILGGLDRAYEGEVIIGEKDIKKYNSNFYRRYVVGTVFQQFYLIPSLTVYENIALPNTFSKKYRKKELDERINLLLDRVGLANRAGHKPKELSGGQAQRVAIARALVMDPLIILADEPTGNLDSHTGQEIVGLLQELNQEQNTTLVIVTHDSKLMEQVATHIHLRDGEIDEDKLYSRLVDNND